jgi:hypothetical protein
LLTPDQPPLVRPGVAGAAGDAPGPDAWRRRQAAAEVLERALRAGRHSGVALERLAWGPALLRDLRQAGQAGQAGPAESAGSAGSAGAPPGPSRAEDAGPS